jgi:hypothetical protein
MCAAMPGSLAIRLSESSSTGRQYSVLRMPSEYAFANSLVGCSERKALPSGWCPVPLAAHQDLLRCQPHVCAARGCGCSQQAQIACLLTSRKWRYIPKLVRWRLPTTKQTTEDL